MQPPIAPFFHRTTLLVIAAFALITANAADAAPTSAPASLHLKQKDIERVILQLEPQSKPEVLLYITKGKLSDFLALTEANLNKPISIFMDGKLVTAPVITKPFVQTIRFLTLKFPDFDSAALVARSFSPTK